MCLCRGEELSHTRGGSHIPGCCGGTAPGAARPWQLVPFLPSAPASSCPPECCWWGDTQRGSVGPVSPGTRLGPSTTQVWGHPSGMREAEWASLASGKGGASSLLPDLGALPRPCHLGQNQQTLVPSAGLSRAVPAPGTVWALPGAQGSAGREPPVPGAGPDPAALTRGLGCSREAAPRPRPGLPGAGCAGPAERRCAFVGSSSCYEILFRSSSEPSKLT